MNVELYSAFFVDDLCLALLTQALTYAIFICSPAVSKPNGGNMRYLILALLCARCAVFIAAPKQASAQSAEKDSPWRVTSFPNGEVGKLYEHMNCAVYVMRDSSYASADSVADVALVLAFEFREQGLLESIMMTSGDTVYYKRTHWRAPYPDEAGRPIYVQYDGHDGDDIFVRQCDTLFELPPKVRIALPRTLVAGSKPKEDP